MKFLSLLPSPKFDWGCYDTPKGKRAAIRIQTMAKTMLKRIDKAIENKPAWGCNGAIIDITERFVWSVNHNVPDWFIEGGGTDTEPRCHVIEFAEVVLGYAKVHWRKTV